jgi:PAS domain S-box-containing protein
MSTLIGHQAGADLESRAGETAPTADLSRRLSLLQLLSRAVQAANESPSTDDALAATIDLVCEHTGWVVGHAYLVEPVGQLRSTGIWHLERPEQHQAFREATEAMDFEKGFGLPGQVLTERRSIWIEDVTADRDFLRKLAAAGLGGAVAFPVLSGDEVVGVMEFFADLPVVPDPPLLETMATIGAQLGRAVERERSASALRASESKLSAIISIAAEGIISIDDSHTIMMFNQAAERIFGYSAEEAVGQPLSMLIPERFRESHERHVPNFAEGSVGARRMSERQPVWGLRKTGEEFPVEVSISKLRSSGGRIMTAVLRDISKRVQAEEALRASEERFQLAARAASDVIWDWTIASGRVEWSGAVEAILRCSPQEVGEAIEAWYQRIHPEDRERVIGSIQRALDSTAEFWSEEYRLLRGDGSYASVLDQGYIVRGAHGGAERMIGSIADVTERKRVEDMHRLLAQASSLLAGSLDHRIALGSLSPLIVPALADYLVVHEAGEEGRLERLVVAYAANGSASVLIAGEPKPETMDEGDPLDRVVKTGRPLVISDPTHPVLKSFVLAEELPTRNSGGALRSLMVVPLVARDRSLGAITLATASSGRWYGPSELNTVQDLAHRIALSLDNAHLYRKEQEAVRLREEVLGVVSHDLRSPIHTIKMSASMLLEPARERREKNVRWLETIERAADQMNTLIGNLLDASRIESGSFAVAQSECDLESLLDDALDLFRPIAVHNSIELRSRVSGELASAWIDSSQILRVLANLVGNAIEFTPKGGTITLSAERLGDEFRLAVADTGPGIPPEHLPHVFERYWKARAGDRRGSGLGLAIAKAIVEAHGGRIWAESTPRKGSTFWFTLPVRAVQETDAPGAAVSGTADGRDAWGDHLAV